MFAHRVLADSETQKVKAYLPLMFVEGVDDTGLARFEAQAHPCQPRLCLFFQTEQRVQFGVEDDQIIGEPDYPRFVMPGQGLDQFRL
jgi:hypothetical protein